MACACKVNQDLAYLQNKYGSRMPQNKKTNISESFGNIMSDLMVRIFSLLLVPFVFIDVLFVTKKHKKTVKFSDFTAFKRLRKKHG